MSEKAYQIYTEPGGPWARSSFGAARLTRSC